MNPDDIILDSPNSSSQKESVSSEQLDVPKEDHCSCYQSPNSFFNLATIAIKSIQLNAPFPKDLEYEQLVYSYSTNFMEGFEVKDKEGVVCTNSDIVKRQSGILSEMAKQVAKGLFTSGIISISLPIRIFEPRSMLERYTDWWSFAPILLKKAGGIGNKLEAFKYVICFTLSSLFRSSGQLKPFNPMLGETFQGTFEDGTKIYMEHTCHTPCVSHYLVIDPENVYKLSGYCDINIEGAMKMIFNNYVTMVQKGKNTVYLSSTDQVIDFQFPKVILGGMVAGSRYVLFDGHMKFEDRRNSLKAVICFNRSHKSLKNRRVHDFYGELFYNEFPEVTKNEQFFEDKLPKNAFPESKMVISEIKGSWLENVIFDNQIYWSIWDSVSPQIFPEKVYAIPSDSRYREDRIWLKRANESPEYHKLYEGYAQNWKLAVEAQQRYDKTLREKNIKK